MTSDEKKTVKQANSLNVSLEPSESMALNSFCHSPAELGGNVCLCCLYSTAAQVNRQCNSSVQDK
jgi:hypothetical protein